MVPVSSGWIAAHKETLLPEMFVEITYTVTEPGLQQDASSTGSNEAYFSNAEQVVVNTDKNSEKYATLEQGLWGLDGTVGYLNSPKNPGYVSGVISNANCKFSSNPILTIDLGSQHTVLVPGMTITWSETYNEWATDFRVSAYNSGELVAEKTVSGNSSPISKVDIDLIRYTQIKVEIMGWSLPYHRARCIDIYLGLEQIYTKDDLLSFEHSQSVDLLSAALPKNQISFDLRNDDNRWNPDAPTGSEQYLMEQQEIKVRYGMNVNGEVEWIKGGTFWLSEWSTPSNGISVQFTARDALEFMNEVYTGPRAGTLREIALAALDQTDLATYEDGSKRYYVDASLKDLTTDFAYDTSEFTIAEVLQMVAHAGCCVLYQDRDSMVHIEPWADVYSGYMIEPHISFTHPEYTMSKPLKSVSVGYGDNTREIIDVNDKGVVQTVDNTMIRTQADALRVGKKAKSILENRKVITGEFRADVRLDALDNVIITSKYASNIIGVTEITYSTTGGAFKGAYTGRVVSIDLKAADRRSGEFYAGEV